MHVCVNSDVCEYILDNTSYKVGARLYESWLDGPESQSKTNLKENYTLDPPLREQENAGGLFS